MTVPVALTQRLLRVFASFIDSVCFFALKKEALKTFPPVNLVNGAPHSFIQYPSRHVDVGGLRQGNHRVTRHTMNASKINSPVLLEQKQPCLVCAFRGVVGGREVEGAFSLPAVEDFSDYGRCFVIAYAASEFGIHPEEAREDYDANWTRDNWSVADSLFSFEEHYPKGFELILSLSGFGTCLGFMRGKLGQLHRSGRFEPLSLSESAEVHTLMWRTAGELLVDYNVAGPGEEPHRRWIAMIGAAARCAGK